MSKKIQRYINRPKLEDSLNAHALSRFVTDAAREAPQLDEPANAQERFRPLVGSLDLAVAYTSCPLL